MSLKDMTPDELRKLADSIEEYQQNIIIKEGFLNSDLYMYSGVGGYYPSCNYISEGDLSIELQNFKNIFTKVAEKGDRFICYKSEPNYWHSEDGEVEYIDYESVKDYLTGIRKV